MHERGEGISQGIYYKWSKDFMEAGKKRLAGDTARAASTDEVKELRREAKDLKEVVAEQTLELRLLKKQGGQACVRGDRAITTGTGRDLHRQGKLFCIKGFNLSYPEVSRSDHKPRLHRH